MRKIRQVLGVVLFCITCASATADELTRDQAKEILHETTGFSHEDKLRVVFDFDDLLPLERAEGEAEIFRLADLFSLKSVEEFDQQFQGFSRLLRWKHTSFETTDLKRTFLAKLSGIISGPKTTMGISDIGRARLSIKFEIEPNYIMNCRDMLPRHKSCVFEATKWEVDEVTDILFDGSRRIVHYTMAPVQTEMGAVFPLTETPVAARAIFMQSDTGWRHVN